MMARLVAALIGVALLVAAVLTVMWVVVGAAAAFGAWRLWQAYSTHAEARAHRRAELLARAEIQHRWYLAGDPRGTFGRYPPARVFSVRY